MIDRKLTESFATISLEEMGKVRLMNRIDTKYVTTVDKIIKLLEAASSEFYIQEIAGRSNMPYYTRYYDTPDKEMYHRHQSGKKPRQKIRVRHYEESTTEPFIEIKSKNNKGRTRKKRVSMTEGEELPPYSEFLDSNSNYDSKSLVPQLENHFYRITLVNKEMTERVTIDTNLEFHNLTTDRRVKLPDIGIIEWKRDGQSRKSSLAGLLRELRLHPGGFSKYCIGMAVTDPDIKQNRLKEKIRNINKLSREQELVRVGAETDIHSRTSL